jgi:hypothetical protein
LTEVAAANIESASSGSAKMRNPKKSPSLRKKRKQEPLATFQDSSSRPKLESDTSLSLVPTTKKSPPLENEPFTITPIASTKNYLVIKSQSHFPLFSHLSN